MLNSALLRGGVHGGLPVPVHGGAGEALGEDRVTVSGSFWQTSRTGQFMGDFTVGWVKF